jgi:hypothetical protein
VPPAEYGKRLAAGRYELALGRLAVQVPRADALLAGAHAAAGDPGAARRCMKRRRCGWRQARGFMKALPLLPLVHARTRIHHDARLRGLSISAGGRVRYADAYLRRGAP